MCFEIQYNLKWTQIVYRLLFSYIWHCWGCSMQTLWAENHFVIKYHQMDAKQQQRRFVPFLCDRNPSSLHPPPSTLLRCHWQLRTSWDCPENCINTSTQSNTLKLSQHKHERRRVTAHFLLWTFNAEKKIFFSGTADLEVGPPLFVHGPPVCLWLITTQISAKILQIHPNIGQNSSDLERNVIIFINLIVKLLLKYAAASPEFYLDLISSRDSLFFLGTHKTKIIYLIDI